MAAQHCCFFVLYFSFPFDLFWLWRLQGLPNSCNYFDDIPYLHFLLWRVRPVCHKWQFLNVINSFLSSLAWYDPLNVFKCLRFSNWTFLLQNHAFAKDAGCSVLPWWRVQRCWSDRNICCSKTSQHSWLLSSCHRRSIFLHPSPSLNELWPRYDSGII